MAGEARRPLAAPGAPGRQQLALAPTEPQAWRIRVESVAATSQDSLVAAVVAGATSAAAAAAVEIASDAGGGGGGGGSSFAAPGATDVEHEKGVNSGNGSVTISW